MNKLILRSWLDTLRAFLVHFFEELEKEELFLFVPVCLGGGIAYYFSFSTEPVLWGAGLFLLLTLFIVYFCRTLYPHIWFALGILLFAVGLVSASLRTIIVKAPVLERSQRAAKVKAVIKSIERRSGVNWRLTLKPIYISRVKKKDIPHLIRLGGRQKNIARLKPGQLIDFKAALFRPSRPSVPLGYDFARKAYFQKIGAVGYIISKIRVVKNNEKKEGFRANFSENIARLRQNVSNRIMDILPDQKGAIATALITGQRGGIDKALYDDIRYSGLAHLLAISGLHMAVMAGSLFWLVHMLLALSSKLALLWPIRKWAVSIALIGATFYLFLSGGGIATQRAYIMLLIAFMAILFDRPALTLRNLAIAACMILLLSPENLLEAGFQMSFATTAALISFYEARQRRLSNVEAKALETNPAIQKPWRFMKGVFLTSLIAGFAVIPFSAFHFHQIAVYSLAGNLLVMPVFVFIVMPMTLLTLILMPFGLEALALQIMAIGLSYIIGAAKMVASWQGAVFSFPIFSTQLLIVMTIGGLWLVLLKSKFRFIGLLPLLSGLYLSLNFNELPFVIDAKMEAVAIREENITQLEKGQYQLIKFARKKSGLERWLKFSNRPYRKVAKKDMVCDAFACLLTWDKLKVSIVKERSALFEECQKADIVITGFALRHKAQKCPLPKYVISQTDLKKYGAYGLYLEKDQLRVLSVLKQTGQRPWSYKIRSWKPWKTSKFQK